MITMKKILFVSALALTTMVPAQVTVTGSSLTPYVVTPTTICNVTLLNSQTETMISLDASVYNSAGEMLLHVRTNPFRAANGVTVVQGSMFSILETNYGTGSQAAFLQAQKQLPSGMFKHCVHVINGGGETEDEW